MRFLHRAGRRLEHTAALLELKRALRSSGAKFRSIPSYTTDEELLALFRLAMTLPEGSRALEVGSHLGASALVLGAAVSRKNGLLYCVDTWMNDAMPDGRSDTFATFEKNIAGLERCIEVIRKDSSSLEESDLSLPLDFAFVDGDHRYEMVREDIAFLSRCLRQGGLLALHDTRSFAGVARALGEVLVGGEFRLEGHVRNLTWLTKTPPAN